MQTKQRLEKEDILEIFRNGCKKEQNVGVEYERLEAGA